MKVQYFREYSYNLGRDMEFKIYGESGKLCIAFPAQNGRVYDFENFGMTESAAPWIESGKIRLICPDSIDRESWSDENGDPTQRIRRQEQWFHYITDELYWRVGGGNGQKAMVTGCSMGGVHAANFFFRRPDLFDTAVSLSGLYNADYFFHGYRDELVYHNSPIHFVADMPQEHPYMQLYRNSSIILCVGQGAWEEDELAGTREMETVLKRQRIPAWVDYWGWDVCHDWCWWKKQLPYFLSILMN